MTEFDIVCMVGIAFLLGIVGGTIALLKFTCNHSWETIDDLRKAHPIKGYSKVYVLRCKNCGKLKHKEVK
ncbi:hypothetical protein Acj9p221 [Acinetobacter phage Acj9]|uniref:Uncharacterized protein n=1 Tax=Acinetobacter phage Acj9 TaxID=760939 RepID=E5EQ05_9CAUD|nr:hypothetical protein Acj9p221 [Acinetobacter phage Acj9]ADG60121.1 hypothetical protein Acj9p221 [Acinetobacter phage Acj9]